MRQSDANFAVISSRATSFQGRSSRSGPPCTSRIKRSLSQSQLPRDDVADKGGPPPEEAAAAAAADKDKHAKLKEELEKINALAEVSPNLAASLKSRAEEIQKEN